MARNLWAFARVILFLSFVLILWNIYWIFSLNQTRQTSATPTFTTKLSPGEAQPLKSTKRVEETTLNSRGITIAAVACGNRAKETVVMMKSAVMLSMSPIQFILFVDENAGSTIEMSVKSWPANISSKFHLDLHPITFPPQQSEEWKKLFKPCASQRLFLPVGSIISNVCME